jgi:sugar phosphate isomerase/epimerase
MKKLSRREFLGKTTIGFGSVMLATRLPFNSEAEMPAGTVKMPVGFQAWVVKEMIAKDFQGTLKMMTGYGYQSIEMCSPVGYESLGFGGLINLKGKELKKIINDAGLKLISTHYGMDEFRKQLDERIEFASESGQKQMIVSMFPFNGKPTLDDWKKSADELNKMAEKTKKAGIQMGYHNHHMEFEKIDGTLIYDALMETFDPKLVKMQFQVAVISVGYKAADYFKKYPGRFISAHLADWSETTGNQVPIGEGVVDWKEFFASLKTGGVKNIFVEMDPETLKPSASYLKNL